MLSIRKNPRKKEMISHIVDIISYIVLLFYEIRITFDFISLPSSYRFTNQGQMYTFVQAQVYTDFDSYISLHPFRCLKTQNIDTCFKHIFCEHKKADPCCFLFFIFL